MKGRAARILIAMAILMTACSSQGSTPPVSAPVTSTQVQGPTPSASETPDPVPANLSGPNGRIAFTRHDPSLGARAGDEESVTYTVNPDGSHVQQLFADAPSGRPRWSPDGTEIQIFCCDDGMAAHFIDPDTGDLRTLRTPP